MSLPKIKTPSGKIGCETCEYRGSFFYHNKKTYTYSLFTIEIRRWEEEEVTIIKCNTCSGKGYVEVQSSCMLI